MRIVKYYCVDCGLGCELPEDRPDGVTCANCSGYLQPIGIMVDDQDPDITLHTKLREEELTGTIIGGKRVCGKTTRLIQESHDKWEYILCADRKRLDVVTQMAKYMDLDIPFPITVRELPLRAMKNLLVDDLEAVLFMVTGANVLMASTSFKFEEMKSLRWEE